MNFETALIKRYIFQYFNTHVVVISQLDYAKDFAWRFSRSDVTKLEGY